METRFGGKVPCRKHIQVLSTAIQSTFDSRSTLDQQTKCALCNCSFFFNSDGAIVLFQKEGSSVHIFPSVSTRALLAMNKQQRAHWWREAKSGVYCHSDPLLYQALDKVHMSFATMFFSV
jgi:hypothetical protein